MTRIKIPPPLSSMGEVFRSGGFSAYLVGGAVRDALRGVSSADWDVATDAPPDAVRRLFRRTVPTGIAHGTVTVILGSGSGSPQVEVTTFRADGPSADSRHPDAVSFGVTLEEDLSRRDFTINAMAADLEKGLLTDPFGGQTDLEKRLIRTVGDSAARFDEDCLRPVRAIRFAATLGFTLDPVLVAAIPPLVGKVAAVSVERFRDEFTKMLKSPVPSVALRLLESTGLLSVFIPELASARGITQADSRGHHRFDVLDHLFLACDSADADDITVRLAALLHDIGKPATRKVEGDKITFYGHENVGAAITAAVLTRLRFPSALLRTVTHLVQEHMFHYTPDWSSAAVRRFLVKVGAENVPSLFDLRFADCCATAGAQPNLQGGEWTENLLELQERIDAVIREEAALSLKDLAVSGKDLLAAGIPPGKKMGAILAELLETVLDDPGENEYTHLMEIALGLAQKGHHEKR